MHVKPPIIKMNARGKGSSERQAPMNIKFLLFLTWIFYLSWKKADDGFFLFCSLFAAALSLCVLCYRVENPVPYREKEKE